MKLRARSQWRSTAPPSGALERLPASDSLYWDYLQALPNGAVIAMDLQPDSEELGERPTVQFWEGSCVQFSVVKVSDGEWRLLDGGGRAT